MGAGYVLGRKHKMRLALLLGAAAASGRLPSAPGELLKRSPLGSATGLDKAGLGGRLAQAGKAAAVTVASSQIESITDRLHSRAESLRKGGKAESEEAEEAEEPQERPQAGRKQRPEEEDEYDEEPYDADESYEEEEKPETPRGRTGRRAAEPEDTDAEDVDEEPEEPSESDEEPEAERRPARAAGSRRASPIRRGGR
jgi:hypothetical protein